MILHITDTHFGTERPQVVRALLDLAQRRRPKVVILSGDVTQRARPQQFALARAFIDALCEACGVKPATNLLVIPGNHDIPLFNVAARLLDPYGQFSASFGPALGRTLHIGNMWVTGVNTTRPWRHRHGELSASQINRVADSLRAVPGHCLKLVVTHQPLHVVEANDQQHLVRGHAAATNAWAAAGADLLLFGHIHQSFVAPLPRPNNQTWVVQTGTAVSARTREQVPNSVHLVQVADLQADQRALVERWDYDGAAAFEQVASTTVPARRTPVAAGPEVQALSIG